MSATGGGEIGPLIERLRARLAKRRVLVDSPVLTRWCLVAIESLRAENEGLRAEVEAFREAVRTGVGPMCEDVCMRECIGPCGGAYIGSQGPRP